MQVARNYFLSLERTFMRKFNEILLAIEIERRLSKEEIFELYVNRVFLGHRAYGFEAAAQVYYGRGIGELTLAQHAMLAGIPKAPSRNNPLSGPEAGKAAATGSSGA
jgi:penicillin-binding protein 1A